LADRVTELQLLTIESSILGDDITGLGGSTTPKNRFDSVRVLIARRDRDNPTGIKRTKVSKLLQNLAASPREAEKRAEPAPLRRSDERRDECALVLTTPDVRFEEPDRYLLVAVRTGVAAGYWMDHAPRTVTRTDAHCGGRAVWFGSLRSHDILCCLTPAVSSGRRASAE